MKQLKLVQYLAQYTQHNQRKISLSLFKSNNTLSHRCFLFLQFRGLLKFTTDRERIYLSTNGSNFRGIDMLNNDHMMIMFFAVTSTFAMAMVPFARTATTVAMMYPTMTVMSSMVTTTAATMSVITMTMLMNMMSPAMTVVLVNKMSPAVTVMPSDMISCTSVMSAGAVVS
ncbi:hypothetical protein LOK49_LG08G02761 [Camellia lanceoleosa]|uniref:Uncharacterized protein n=1 Tax=Camellia lanceoleosa TaxID=1840588 RepID=A0ACC0GSV3_9ERIC|nr:hypothetical protein LOK49_LG08G02761 [Camellia lanceoleosa]